LHNTHPEVAIKLGNIWNTIENKIAVTVNTGLERQYKIIFKNAVKQKQPKDYVDNHIFIIEKLMTH
jgi:hypothetical protein